MVNHDSVGTMTAPSSPSLAAEPTLASIPHERPQLDKRRLFVLSLASLGIVFGDIGTSPLYAMRECFYGEHAIAPTPPNVLGVLSLILWSLIMIISIKYLVLILRADNRGEGGILALAALGREMATRGKLLFMLGLFGAALLYADGMITPAITVMGAVEGLHVLTPLFDPYVVPLAIVILIGIFMLQSHGTTKVGSLFGPVTMIWFLTLAVLGISQIARAPQVLWAVNPWDGVQFFAANGFAGFIVLGAVFLAVTGGEALYADLGHFGTAPIRLTWFSVVLPALVLNYFGQGALLLVEPEAAVNPFFRMTPSWGLSALVLLSAAAAVIASQAVISGAFSLTMQAIQLGYSPRLRVLYTSAKIMGQIYVPAVNWLLMISCVGLVIGFGSSSNLAAAYGVAIATTMLITTILFYTVARRRWHWPLWAAGFAAAAFLCVDLLFFGANMVKIFHGGWFPLLVSGVILFFMLTWRKGRKMLALRMQQMTLPLDDFLADCGTQRIHRVPGTAVFMSGNSQGTPLALLHNLKHNKMLHEHVVVLTVITEESPYIAKRSERTELQKLTGGFWRVKLHFGFMEKPDVPAALARIKDSVLRFPPMKTTYFIGRETVLSTKRRDLSRWRGAFFAWMTRNTGDVTSYFGLPPNSVVELGARVEV